MTGHQIDNFVGSLVEMAKAFEERPELHRQISDKDREIERLIYANKNLADSNDIIRNHVADLEAKIAEVTKERDDAGFRCLEADDRSQRILDLARTLQTGLGQIVAEVEPPKPEPESSVSTDPTSIETGIGEYGNGTQDSGSKLADPASQGQSEADPTVASMVAPSADTASHTEPAEHGTAQGQSSNKPSLWLEGGGTEYDYHWRPSF